MRSVNGLKRIGVLTGGGDSSGINATLHGICLEARKKGIEVFGLLNGWQGAIEGDYLSLDVKLTMKETNRSGTVIGTSRTNPYKINKEKQILQTMRSLSLDGLIAIGGNDTLSVASRLSSELDLKIVGIPQTIDNDVPGTNYCVGFDTAVQNATWAINNVRATCDSHQEDIVVEAMGRDSGWIAAVAGLTSGAEFIFVPEAEFDVDDLIDKLKARHSQGFFSNVIVVAEGIKGFAHTKIDSGVDAFGNVMLAGIGLSLRDYIQKELGKKTRAIVLSYIQRGGAPTSHEIFMALNFGQTALKLLEDNKAGHMVVYTEGKFSSAPLDLARGVRPLSKRLLTMVEGLTL